VRSVLFSSNGVFGSGYLDAQFGNLERERIKFEGICYDVIERGCDRGKLFAEDAAGEVFERMLGSLGDAGSAQGFEVRFRDCPFHMSRHYTYRAAHSTVPMID